MGDLDLDLDLVTEYAALAPSVHNTQPWTLDAGPSAVRVRADRSRQLSYLDPDGRQLSLSCGIAAEFARLAVRAQDRRCDVVVLPDPSDGDLLAELTAGDGDPAGDDERRLAEAIPRRYTDRLPYEPDPVPPEVVGRLRRAAESAGAWLHVVARPEDRVALAAILEDAEATEAADPRYTEELARWRHPRAARDGLPAEATPESWPPGVVSDVPLRDFSGHGRHPRPDAGDPPTVERDMVVLVGSDRDDPAAWVQTGMALGRVLLTATADGLVAQPLGPATDFPATRARLRRELRLAGHPQFAFRLGYGRDQPRTSRRGDGPRGAAGD